MLALRSRQGSEEFGILSWGSSGEGGNPGEVIGMLDHEGSCISTPQEVVSSGLLIGIYNRQDASRNNLLGSLGIDHSRFSHFN